ncbi:unnamed protein product [Closterium sp. Naga37s-1]|nr:unnamed protein product [Closterium sp. Naga37s-1]
MLHRNDVSFRGAEAPREAIHGSLRRREGRATRGARRARSLPPNCSGLLAEEEGDSAESARAAEIVAAGGLARRGEGGGAASGISPRTCRSQSPRGRRKGGRSGGGYATNFGDENDSSATVGRSWWTTDGAPAADAASITASDADSGVSSVRLRNQHDGARSPWEGGAGRALVDVERRQSRSLDGSGRLRDAAAGRTAGGDGNSGRSAAFARRPPAAVATVESEAALQERAAATRAEKGATGGAGAIAREGASAGNVASAGNGASAITRDAGADVSGDVAASVQAERAEEEGRTEQAGNAECGEGGEGGGGERAAEPRWRDVRQGIGGCGKVLGARGLEGNTLCGGESRAPRDWEASETCSMVELWNPFYNDDVISIKCSSSSSSGSDSGAGSGDDNERKGRGKREKRGKRGKRGRKARSGNAAAATGDGGAVAAAAAEQPEAQPHAASQDYFPFDGFFQPRFDQLSSTDSSCSPDLVFSFHPPHPTAHSLPCSPLDPSSLLDCTPSLCAPPPFLTLSSEKRGSGGEGEGITGGLSAIEEGKEGTEAGAAASGATVAADTGNSAVTRSTLAATAAAREDEGAAAAAGSGSDSDSFLSDPFHRGVRLDDVLRQWDLSAAIHDDAQSNENEPSKVAAMCTGTATGTNQDEPVGSGMTVAKSGPSTDSPARLPKPSPSPAINTKTNNPSNMPPAATIATTSTGTTTATTTAATTTTTSINPRRRLTSTVIRGANHKHSHSQPPYSSSPSSTAIDSSLSPAATPPRTILGRSASLGSAGGSARLGVRGGVSTADAVAAAAAAAVAAASAAAAVLGGGGSMTNNLGTSAAAIGMAAVDSAGHLSTSCNAISGGRSAIESATRKGGEGMRQIENRGSVLQDVQEQQQLQPQQEKQQIQKEQKDGRQERLADVEIVKPAAKNMQKKTEKELPRKRRRNGEREEEEKVKGARRRRKEFMRPLGVKRKGVRVVVGPRRLELLKKWLLDVIADAQGKTAVVLGGAMGQGLLVLAAPKPLLPAVLRWLQQQGWVQWVAPRPRSRLHNRWASAVTQSGSSVSLDDDPGFRSPGSGSGGDGSEQQRSEFGVARPLWSAGITGVGQIVGIGDSGIDMQSCFFRDDAVPLPGPNHRKVVQYRVVNGDTVDELGHGTHVAGSVAGVCSQQQQAQQPQQGQQGAKGPENVDLYPGMAPDARIAFTDMGEGDVGYIMPPGDLGGGYYGQAMKAGALILSDSWASGVFAYDYMAQSVDRFTFNNPNFLPVVAAGNMGAVHRDAELPHSGGDPLRLTLPIMNISFVNQATYTPNPYLSPSPPVSISSPALAKNCLTVGATLGSVGSAPPLLATPFNLSLLAPSPSLLPSDRAWYPLLSHAFGATFQSGLWEFRNAQAAGAAAAVIVANDTLGYFPMAAPFGADPSITIPGGSVPQAVGAIIDAALRRGQPVQVSISPLAVSLAFRPDSMARFSSWGPTPDGRIKPDISAPGNEAGTAYARGGHMVSKEQPQPSPAIVLCYT